MSAFQNDFIELLNRKLQTHICEALIAVIKQTSVSFAAHSMMIEATPDGELCVSFKLAWPEPIRTGAKP